MHFSAVINNKVTRLHLASTPRGLFITDGDTQYDIQYHTCCTYTERCYGSSPIPYGHRIMVPVDASGAALRGTLEYEGNTYSIYPTADGTPSIAYTGGRDEDPTQTCIAIRLR